MGQQLMIEPTLLTSCLLNYCQLPCHRSTTAADTRRGSLLPRA
jgi:hypothetical protein